MKLAVMQPYFFPYIGYYQLIHAVDAFVFYDDVNFIKGGWINRNYILSQERKSRITLELRGASPNVLINQVLIGANRRKILKSIQQSYARAPNFSLINPLLEEILTSGGESLSEFVSFGIRKICKYLHIDAEWHTSSDLRKDGSLRGQDKILAICEELGASHYINLPGGRSLYEKDVFLRRGIELCFLEPRIVKYAQTGGDFEPGLSIIDVLMFNDRLQCNRLLEEFSLA